MGKKTIILLLIFLGTISIAFGKYDYTSVYYFLNSSYEHVFSNEEGFNKLDNDLINSPISFSVSLYKEDLYVLSLAYTNDKYLFYNNFELGEFKRNSLEFSLGKVFSFPVLFNEKLYFTPDIIGGVFIKYFMISTNDVQNISSGAFAYGFYFDFKLKLNIIRDLIKIKSVDIGYRYSVPISNNLHDSEEFLITSRNGTIYLGFSF